MISHSINDPIGSSDNSEEKFHLYVVRLDNIDYEMSRDIEYLCSDPAWADAVLYYIYGGEESFFIGREKDYYPSIRRDHPNAIVIPPITPEARDAMLTVELQTPVAILERS